MKTKLAQVIRVMRQAHDRDVSRFDESFLVKSLEARRVASASPDAAAYVQRLTEDHAEAEALAGSLNNHYSEFFRNPLTFALLEQLILPRLAEAREKSGSAEIRIWSAACAAGQEAWSVAILLDEMAGLRGKPIPFRIFATDISETELAVARQGVYEAAAVQNVRRRHLQNYFLQQGETFAIIARLKGQVAFSVYDLLDEHGTSPPTSIFGDFDLVLCGNLLFYYRPDRRQAILNKLWHGLSPQGFFVTGEAEREIVDQTDGFRAVIPAAAVFQKSGRIF